MTTPKPVRMWGCYDRSGLQSLAYTEQDAKDQYIEIATLGLPVAKPSFDFYRRDFGAVCVPVIIAPEVDS